MTIVGTWNLENLFRPGDDGPSGEEEYDAKLDSLAATITDLAPDLLAVQEVGDPDALDDLVTRLDGDWHTALADPDARGIRVGILSRHALSEVEQVADYPQHLNPVQVDDDGHTLDKLGRPGLRARVDVDVDGTSLEIVTAHLKSKLLSFPSGRFAPRDEDERARFAVYALHRRAAEAAGLRTYLTALLDGKGKHRAVVLAGDMNDEPQSGDHPDSAWPTRLRNRHPRIRPARSRGRTAAVEPGAAHPRGGAPLPCLPGPQGTHRPPPRQPPAPRHRRDRDDRDRRHTVDHRQPGRATRCPGLRPPASRGEAEPVAVDVGQSSRPSSRSIAARREGQPGHGRFKCWRPRRPPTPTQSQIDPAARPNICRVQTPRSRVFGWDGRGRVSEARATPSSPAR
jgi:endonuclease/exonuclease/phosphatase family metal-dependent hydrolase